jgi:Flp pilus assembly protein TadG
MPTLFRRRGAFRAAAAAGARRHVADRASGRRRQRGQGLIEFALVFPLFIYLLMSVIEFGFFFNATLQTNFSTRNAALIAAEAGNNENADCFILRQIESDTTIPNSAVSIQEVRVFRANRDGSEAASSIYTRTGPTSCQESDGTPFTVPYSVGSEGYPPSNRCNEVPRTLPSGATVLPCRGLSPARTDVDTVGVQVTYVYKPKTPMLLPWLGLLLELRGSDYVIIKSNQMRMEPVL